MNKNYLVKLKNGDTITISETQHKSLSDILSSAKPPAFIKIENNMVRTDYIAFVKAEDW
jgi:hypothetical protein